MRLAGLSHPSASRVRAVTESDAPRPVVTVGEKSKRSAEVGVGLLCVNFAPGVEKACYTHAEFTLGAKSPWCAEFTHCTTAEHPAPATRARGSGLRAARCGTRSIRRTRVWGRRWCCCTSAARLVTEWSWADPAQTQGPQPQVDLLARRGRRGGIRRDVLLSAFLRSRQSRRIIATPPPLPLSPLPPPPPRRSNG